MLKDPNSVEKAAFSIEFRKYQFRVMPFGLPGVPMTFQRLMNAMFGGMTEQVAVYMDDVAIYSTT